MAGNQSAQKRANTPLSLQDWRAQGGAAVSRISRDAASIAPDTWKGIAAAGENFLPGNRRAFLPVGTPYPNTQRAQEQAATKPALDRAIEELNRNQLAKAALGTLAFYAGKQPGMARGAVNGLKGIAETAALAARFIDPIPIEPFQRDQQKVTDDIINGGKTVIDYAKRAAADPQILRRDALAYGKKWNVDHNPFASPIADTALGELKREFDIGQNVGEAEFDAGTLIFGGAPRRLGILGSLGKAKGAAKYLGEFNAAQAERLAKPYTGVGHHQYIKQSATFADGSEIPKWIMDHPANVLKLRGGDTGDMYKRHFTVDDRFNNAWFGKKIGGNWNGKTLGLKKYGPIGQFWFGAPDAMREIVGSTGAAGLYQNTSDENQTQ